jgi:hypothetical protein
MSPEDKEQMGFDFGEQDLGVADDEQLQRAFQGFHEKHPEVWNTFRRETLSAADAGEWPFHAHTIMLIVRRKTSIPVDSKLIPLYRDLFTSNHQELAHVFKD